MSAAGIFFAVIVGSLEAGRCLGIAVTRSDLKTKKLSLR
jgi:hypothetical protein